MAARASSACRCRPTTPAWSASRAPRRSARSWPARRRWSSPRTRSGWASTRPNVRTVIHEVVPSSLEAYYQEAGRARARRAAVAMRAARREPRQGPARVLHQPGRRPRGQEPPLAPVPRGLGVRRGRASAGGAAILQPLRRSRGARCRGAVLRRLRWAVWRSLAAPSSAERERSRGQTTSGERDTVEQAILQVVREAEPAIGRTRDRRGPARRAQQGGAQVRLRRAARIRRLSTTGAPTTCCARSTR